MKTWQKVSGGLCVVALLMGVALALSYYLEPSFVTPTSHHVRSALKHMACSIVSEAARHSPRPLDLPEGDIHALYRWVMTNSNLKKEIEGRWANWSGWASLVDSVNETFWDYWDNELIYHFPSRRKDFIFELYSVGPNGKDEQGGGDDVTAGPYSSLAAHSSEFSKGLVDPDWVQAHLRELERNPEDGKIIGVDPRVLREPR